MRQWIPISTSPKGRLALAAVRQFGALPYDDVTVAGLAADADVTTGAIYHHFGSKVGLYTFVRDDVEQRLLDRMGGALAAGGVRAALGVGFDFAVGEEFLRMLGVPPTGGAPDRLAGLLAEATTPASGRVLAAAWRAALLAVVDGLDTTDSRMALDSLIAR